MTRIEEKAQEIGTELTQAGYAFDPSGLIAIIKEILSLFKGCGLTPGQAEARAARPRLLDRVRLRRTIWRHNSGGTEEMEAALADAGANLTVADVQQMYTEVP